MKTHKNLFARVEDAFRGISLYFKEELKLYQYLFIIVFFALVIFLIKPSHMETLFILLLFATSVFAGFFNMIVEKLCNLYSQEYNPQIRDIKDLAAGGASLYIIICVAILILIYFK
jgi:diacylglycerol kinase